MTVIVGLQPSYEHSQNGMILEDMRASKRVADKLDEVIIYRSTGPWAKRWVERHYPTKNFHVKGKSSDWGPHAGLVPYNGVWSKVGFDAAKAKKGTEANDDGLHSGFADKTQLILSEAQLKESHSRTEGGRRAVETIAKIPNTDHYFLTAIRSGDQKPVYFHAAKTSGADEYVVKVYPLATTLQQAREDAHGGLAGPLEVMTSAEVPSHRKGLKYKLKAMTGDYDLFAVCPTMAQYGSRLASRLHKPGIMLANGKTKKGIAYEAGVGMDNVLDSRLNSLGSADWHDYDTRVQLYKKRDEARRALPFGFQLSPASQALLEDKSAWTEHGDMGNLTPRILRCILELNIAMDAVGENGPLRRVHHNAESHRYKKFGALTKTDMITIKKGEEFGDGFPLTVFQPATIYSQKGFDKPTARYGDVCTLENLQELRDYVGALKATGFYVPQNLMWESGSSLPRASSAVRETMEDRLARIRHRLESQSRESESTE